MDAQNSGISSTKRNLAMAKTALKLEHLMVTGKHIFRLNSYDIWKKTYIFQYIWNDNILTYNKKTIGFQGASQRPRWLWPHPLLQTDENSDSWQQPAVTTSDDPRTATLDLLKAPGKNKQPFRNDGLLIVENKQSP